MKYLARLTAKGCKPQTVARARNCLISLLEAHEHLQATSITPQRAREIYDTLTASTVVRRFPAAEEIRKSAVSSVLGQARRNLSVSEILPDPRNLEGRRADIATIESRALNKERLRQKGDSSWLINLADRIEERIRKRTGELMLTPPGKTIAAATHHKALDFARSVWKWGIRQGLVKSNPWLDVDKVGRANAGKPQLRTDEARKLADVCMRYALTDDSALSCLMALFMGLRVSEICKRVVRDVDRDCSVLVVEDTKSKNGYRQPEIPEALRPAIRLRLQGRDSKAPLLRAVGGGPMHASAIERALESFCEEAGVPRVVPHALRGGFASALVEAGALTHLVAAVMGHGSFDITAKHYATDEAKEKAQAEQRRRNLAGLRVVK